MKRGSVAFQPADGIIVRSTSKSCIFRLSSPERARLQELQESMMIGDTASQSNSMAPAPLGSSSPLKDSIVLYVPEVEEIRISPVIARKGYLNVLEHKTNGWKKRWVVSIYLFKFKQLIYVIILNFYYYFQGGTKTICIYI